MAGMIKKKDRLVLKNLIFLQLRIGRPGNDEKVSRSWLLYSNKIVEYFAFVVSYLLSVESCWILKIVRQKLKEHNATPDHFNCMQIWKTVANNLQRMQIILFESSHQRWIENKKKHWRSVLECLITFVEKLNERSLAFSDYRECFDRPSKGTFLFQVGFLAKFHPLKSEDLRRIKDKNCFTNIFKIYCQNEMIWWPDF